MVMKTEEYYNCKDLDVIFELIADVDKIKEWVKKNYSPIKCGWTPERSEGNCYDCFDDGYECGTSWAAYEIGTILGLELPEPEKPDYDL